MPRHQQLSLQAGGSGVNSVSISDDTGDNINDQIVWIVDGIADAQDAMPGNDLELPPSKRTKKKQRETEPIVESAATIVQRQAIAAALFLAQQAEARSARAIAEQNLLCQQQQQQQQRATSQQPPQAGLRYQPPLTINQPQSVRHQQNQLAGLGHQRIARIASHTQHNNNKDKGNELEAQHPLGLLAPVGELKHLKKLRRHKYRPKYKPPLAELTIPPTNKAEIEHGRVYLISQVPKIWDGRQWRKICLAEYCARYAVTTGYCKGHGGGNRYSKIYLEVTGGKEKMVKCTESAVDSTLFCKTHGGGQRCIANGDTCLKSSADSSDLCNAHNGGKRRTFLGSTKSAVSPTTLFINHEESKRCHSVMPVDQPGNQLCDAEGNMLPPTDVCGKAVHVPRGFCVPHSNCGKCSVPLCETVSFAGSCYCAVHVSAQGYFDSSMDDTCVRKSERHAATHEALARKAAKKCGASRIVVRKATKRKAIAATATADTDTAAATSSTAAAAADGDSGGKVPVYHATLLAQMPALATALPDQISAPIHGHTDIIKNQHQPINTLQQYSHSQPNMIPNHSLYGQQHGGYHPHDSNLGSPSNFGGNRPMYAQQQWQTGSSALAWQQQQQQHAHIIWQKIQPHNTNNVYTQGNHQQQQFHQQVLGSIYTDGAVQGGPHHLHSKPQQQQTSCSPVSASLVFPLFSMPHLQQHNSPHSTQLQSHDSQPPTQQPVYQKSHVRTASGWAGLIPLQQHVSANVHGVPSPYMQDA